MKLLVVVDGMAEDCTGEPTTLERAYTPFLDQLAPHGFCGLFDPVDEVTQTCETDLIISSLLGIRPHHWPGRAYFESVAAMTGSYVPMACCVLYYSCATGVTDVQQYLQSAMPMFEDLVTTNQAHIILRDYERTASSHLLWVSNETESNPAAAAMRLKKLTEHISHILPAGFSVQIGKAWHNGPIDMDTFRFKPCFLAHAQGSLLGVCRAASFDRLYKSGRAFDLIHRDKLFKECSDILSNNQFDAGLIYFKDTDWASHIGDRPLKQRLIEYIDGWLAKLLSESIGGSADSVLIVSDHRSNIGDDCSSKTPSIFIHIGRGAGPSRFSEREIENQWSSPPISTTDLSRMFLEER